MNILFTRFPLESRMGGAEVQTLSLMHGLKSKGHTVSFLGSCPTLLRESAKYQVTSNKLDIGIPPVTKFGVISFLWRQHSMKKKLSAISQKLSPGDAIVMLSLSEKLLLTDEALKRGIKVVWVEHDPVGRWLTNNPWLSQLKKLSHKVTTVVVSDLSKKIYEGLGFTNVVTITNGIDLTRFDHSKNQKLETSNQTLRVGCIARLAEEKGIDVLLEAVRNLPQAKLTIIGGGPEESFVRNYIADIAAREGISPERIKLVKHVENLDDFYNSLDVFVLPSRTNDPFGMVAAEAMSMGVATIVTDACGIAGYLQNGKDALIVPANDANALNEAAKSLLDNARRSTLATSGQKTARELFDVNKMVEKYERIITQ